jgi:hypothetical protein
MWRFLNNLLFGNRIVGVSQFYDIDRKPHLVIFTSKKVVQVDNGVEQLIATSKQIKNVKESS